MFVKTTRAKGYEYVKLVESYRESGTTKHRVLFNFGRADVIRKDESFLKIVNRLCEILKSTTSEGEFDESLLDGCNEEAELFNYGYIPYFKLWKEHGIEGCVEIAQSNTKLTFSLSQTVFLMVCQHLLSPMSKLATFERQGRYFNMPEIPLHQMYRALEYLSSAKDEIEKELFEYNYVRANKTVEVVFYDLTTLHFESQLSDEELREFGFSKAGKYNEVQVMLGLIIDADGIPVGYELLKGNTYEGHTIAEVIKKIQKRFKIRRVIIVADRGLNNKDALNEIKKAGCGYIMAAKIKGSSAQLQKKIFDEKGFVAVCNKEGELEFKYKVMPHENVFKDESGEKHILQENMVVTYSTKRAKKDMADRERVVAKAEKLLEEPGLIASTNKRGGRKYIDQTNKDKEKPTYNLACDKIEKDAEFDGYYAIQTSEKTMSATDVMDAYHTLWKIEESFRIMKSTLEIRPIYHSSPERIKGHFVVCFLAFLMERKMELLLKGNTEDEGGNASPQRIQEALNSLQLVSISTSQGEKLIKVRPHMLTSKIFKRIGINMPNYINTKEDLLDHFKLIAEPTFVQMSLL
jgi:transposase